MAFPSVDPPLQPGDPGPYWYITLLGDVAPKDVNHQPYLVMSSRLLIEHALTEFRSMAERADYVGETRVYRVEQRYLGRFPKDAKGYWVRGGPKLQMYWEPVNPQANSLVVREWVRVV